MVSHVVRAFLDISASMSMLGGVGLNDVISCIKIYEYNDQHPSLASYF